MAGLGADLVLSLAPGRSTCSTVASAGFSMTVGVGQGALRSESHVHVKRPDLDGDSD